MKNELKWRCPSCNQFVDEDTLGIMIKSRVATPVLVQVEPAPKPVRKKRSRPAPFVAKPEPVAAADPIGTIGEEEYEELEETE